MLLSLLNEKTAAAFESRGLDPALGAVTRSNRPDLSDFQCNGALQAAKTLKRPPRDIALEMKAALETTGVFSGVSIDGPGFVNLTLSDAFILECLFRKDVREPSAKTAQKIIIDYGGPNVAKPLHVGHLRSAIIGEAIKRIARALGHKVLGDIHMGDWGTPMGMLLAQLEQDHPAWPYFQEGFAPAAAEKPPLAVEDLNALYPLAAQRFKDDEAFAGKAREATAMLQAGHAGYRALWRHFVDLSVESIKKDFSALDVDFDLWLGEADADKYVPEMVESLKKTGIARESEGALIVDVAREDDKKELPPLILQKKDGAATYGTTDLATIYQRAREENPDKILYVVDQRQSLHFTQVFRAAGRAGIIAEDRLEHIGFGTMNGKDGKPFKTRSGGVMRLGDLIQESRDLALKEAGFAPEQAEGEIKSMIDKVAVASIKFGDLSNLRTTDYIFDPREFIRFDGKTGPYIQYAIVRAGAVLAKAEGGGDAPATPPAVFSGKAERGLALALLGYPEALHHAFEKRMPSDLCDYAYQLANLFNGFYRDCPILTEQDGEVRAFRLFLTREAMATLTRTLGCLAIPVPERMLRAEKHAAA